MKIVCRRETRTGFELYSHATARVIIMCCFRKDFAVLPVKGVSLSVCKALRNPLSNP